MFNDYWNYKTNLDSREGERWLIRKEEGHFHLRIIGKEIYDDEKKEKKLNVLYKDLSKEEAKELRDWLNQALED